jgi:hypothetical protein
MVERKPPAPRYLRPERQNIQVALSHLQHM